METAWQFCSAILGDVSRTFAIPIRSLRPSLEQPITIGYLLCRVVDTVEDEDELCEGDRDLLYDAFLDVLLGKQDAHHFSVAFARLVQCDPDKADHTLALGLPSVMRVFAELPSAHQVSLRAWVREMAHGMRLYSHRRPGPDGLQALLTLGDLERYCYFVAGTVGHLLTDLFLEALPPLSDERRHALLTNAEAFGLGLQLTNILKDITDDRARATSFIPRDVCDAEGLPLSDLLEPAHRERAHAALLPVFERAERALDAAFAYCLAIPAEASDVRLFCLLPLWMAVATLEHARGNDAQFEASQAVKIDRRMVAELLGACTKMASDDSALKRSYGALKTRKSALEARPQ